MAINLGGKISDLVNAPCDISIKFAQQLSL